MPNAPNSSPEKYSLVLASGSPRRRELLSYLGIPFVIQNANIDEFIKITTPENYCLSLANLKARAVIQKLSQSTQDENYGENFFPLVVGADTIVYHKNKIYNKPKDINDARKMLLELSGNTHEVYTGVSLIRLDIKTKEIVENNFFDKTHVSFDQLTQEILEHYLLTNDSLDKAGSYGIQGESLTFISHLVGSYSNVVGFPLNLFITKLREFLNNPCSLKSQFC